MDRFLARHLAPALNQEYFAEQIARFFFIRYFEDGLHLRLRLKPRPRCDAGMIEEWIRGLGRDFSGSWAGAGKCRIERRDYSREEHYFGETVYSVYAELLNEQTSRLALRLLRGCYEQRAELILLLAVTVRFLLKGIAQDHKEFIQAAELSRSFAQDVLAKSGMSPEVVTAAEPSKLHALVRQASARAVPILQGDQVATAIVHLGCRLQRKGRFGRFVLTHAFHLLCNKLGCSMQEEYRLFSCLLIETEVNA
jgi:thiopeptide-type bacteriocin biosynthesis protein